MRKIQNRVSEFEALFRIISEYAQVGYANYNLYNKEGYAQNVWLRNYGEADSAQIVDVIGKYRHIHPEDRKPLLDLLTRFSAGEVQSATAICRVQHDDGRKTWIKTTLNKRISDTFPDKDYIRKVYEDINYYFQMAMGDGMGCTFAFNLDEFCRNFKHFPVQADSALKILTRAGYLEYTDEQDNASRILFTMKRDELYKLHENDTDTEKLINIILRSYTGLFTDYAYINEDSLVIRSGLTRQRIYEILLALTRRHIIHYIPRKKTPYIIYTRERQEKNRLALTREIYEDRKKSYTTRIKAMIEYATADDKCRSRMLLRYFGEKNEHNCGQCDVCLNNHHSGIKQGEFQELEQQIKQLLQAGAMPASELLNQLNSNREKAEKVLSYLLSEEIIQLKDGILSV